MINDVISQVSIDNENIVMLIKLYIIQSVICQDNFMSARGSVLYQLTLVPRVK